MYADQEEQGQSPLETAIVLIAFVVVAFIFAFTILSASSSSTEKGQHAINAALEGVQSSLNVQGSIIAKGASGDVTNIIFTVAPVAGGTPVNLSATAKEVFVRYKDAAQFENQVPWTVKWVISKQTPADDMLEAGELAEITVDLSSLTTPLATNTAFNLEIKP